jgi:hypothetical protein
MKTTIELDSALLQAAKQRALDTNSSLKQVMEQALRQLLRPAAELTVPIRTITFGTPSDSWPLSKAKMRDAAYPDQTTEHWIKLLELEPSDKTSKPNKVNKARPK